MTFITVILIINCSNLTCENDLFKTTKTEDFALKINSTEDNYN
jgi:hypothetical protein